MKFGGDQDHCLYPGRGTELLKRSALFEGFSSCIMFFLQLK